MTLTCTTPFEEGQLAGYLDRATNARSSYAWTVEDTPGFSREYSLGYRAGWHECDRAKTDRKNEESRVRRNQ